MAVDIKRLICVRRYSENAMKNNSRIPGDRGKEQRYRFADARQAESLRNEPTAARRWARGRAVTGPCRLAPASAGASAARGGFHPWEGSVQTEKGPKGQTERSNGDLWPWTQRQLASRSPPVSLSPLKGAQDSLLVRDERVLGDAFFVH